MGRKLYNPDGESFGQPILGGNPTGIMATNLGMYSKKKWWADLYRKMGADFWLPERFDMKEDAKQYHTLVPEYKRGYTKILSFLIFLDSIQTINPMNFTRYITAPEINFLITLQTYQEAVHAISYAYIDESVLPTIEEKKNLYDEWRNDELLNQRNQYIVKWYHDFENNPNDKTFFSAIVANYILEGIYFYNGFKFFYALEAKGLMKATADVISLINRDEISHLILYKNIIKEVIDVKGTLIPESDIIQMFVEAVEWEEKFSISALDKCFGFNKTTITQYTRFLANKRLNAIGIYDHPFSEYTDNPYKHLDSVMVDDDLMMSTDDHVAKEENTFTSGVSTYVKADSMQGWDDLM